MSMSLTVELKQSGYQGDPASPGPASPENCFNAGGLPYVAMDMDRLIRQPGIRRFTEYMYDGDMLGDAEYEEIGQQRPEKKWFDAADGLRTVDHLISIFEQRNLEEPFEGYAVGDLLDELRVIQAILRRAEQLGEPFSFNVG